MHWQCLVGACFIAVINGLMVFNTTAKPVNCNYHLYNPELFDMYTQCSKANYSEKVYQQHGQDSLFYSTLLAMNASMDPAQAHLFIVPALMSLSVIGRCGNHAANLNQMLETIKSLHYDPHNKRRNHFLMAVSLLLLASTIYILPSLT